MTAKELRMAQNCMAAGENYILCALTNWGKPQQRRRDIPFEKLAAEYDMQHIALIKAVAHLRVPNDSEAAE